VVSGTDQELVRQLAAGLRRDPWPVPEPFEVALLPELFRPLTVNDHAMDFVSADYPENPAYISVRITQAYPPGFWGLPGLTVNGNPAIYGDDGGWPSIRVLLPDGTELSVAAEASLRLDQQQLLRIAEGISVTDDAVPFPAQP
jgi:hypothetical protein